MSIAENIMGVSGLANVNSFDRIQDFSSAFAVCINNAGFNVICIFDSVIKRI